MSDLPFPETPEARAAQTRAITEATGIDQAGIERLVRTFYATAREDALLAPMFAHVRDWEHHIANIRRFWESVALRIEGYDGRPMASHAPLPLDAAHFARWLELFEATARGLFRPEGVAYLMERARRIAQSLEMGQQVARRQLPPKRV